MYKFMKILFKCTKNYKFDNIKLSEVAVTCKNIGKTLKIRSIEKPFCMLMRALIKMQC